MDCYTSTLQVQNVHLLFSASIDPHMLMALSICFIFQPKYCS